MFIHCARISLFFSFSVSPAYSYFTPMSDTMQAVFSKKSKKSEVCNGKEYGNRGVKIDKEVLTMVEKIC